VPPSGQELILGTLVEVIGWAFLLSRLRRRPGSRVAGFWQLKVFLGEISLIIGGGILLMKAMGIV